MVEKCSLGCGRLKLGLYFQYFSTFLSCQKHGIIWADMVLGVLYWNSRKQEYLSWAGETLKLFLITGITEGYRQNRVFALLTIMSLRGCLRQPCSYTSPYLWPFGLGQSQLQTTQSFKSQHPEQTPRKGDWVKHRQNWKENGSRQGWK